VTFPPDPVALVAACRIALPQQALGQRWGLEAEQAGHLDISFVAPHSAEILSLGGPGLQRIRASRYKISDIS